MADTNEVPTIDERGEPEAATNESEDSDPELRTDGGQSVMVNPAARTLPMENGPIGSPAPSGPAIGDPSVNDLSAKPSTVDEPTVLGPDADDQSTEALLREFLDSRRGRLESIAPDDALELYLEDKARECAKSTVNAHRSRLGFFVEWCCDQRITNLNDLSARDIHDFRVWRRQGMNVVTERTQLATLRVFIEWCETIDAVESDLYRKVDIPTVDDDARDVALHAARARSILDYLETYEYATTEHVCWVVLTATGMRLGSARAIDVGDYKPDGDPPHLDIRHRPETDTPIKKRSRGERPVGINDEVRSVLDDYLQHQRPAVSDAHGREPLLATPHGRVARSTIRKYVYRWSRPCQVGQDCPHDRMPEDCEAATNLDRAARCPSSASPHAIRRGYITQLLRTSVSVEVVSNRCDVTADIIDQHYDVRSKEDKMRQRQQILNDLQGGDLPYV